MPTQPPVFTRDPEDTLASLIGAPGVQALLDDEERRRASQRAELLAERATVRARIDELAAPLRRAEAALIRAHTPDDRAAAGNDLWEARRTIWPEKGVLESRLAGIERNLRVLADDRVAAFVAWLGEQERLTSVLPAGAVVLGDAERHWHTGDRGATVRSLSTAIAGRLAAIREATTAAAAIPLEVATADEVTARLERLARSIPAIDELQPTYTRMDGRLPAPHPRIG